MRSALFLSLFLFATPLAYGQDSLASPVRKNTVKFDFTSFNLYERSYVFSYERVTKPSQSMVFTAGVQQFPTIINFGKGIFVNRDVRASGYKFGFEYRFYLKKENKYPAPRGVYIGPYLSYLSFSNDRDLEIDFNGTKEFGSLDTKLYVVNTGVQLGYQFILNNRWAIDLVFIGPSISNYRGKMTLDGTFSSDPGEIQNEILQGLIERFPALEDLVAGETVERDGKIDTWSYGFRYQIHVGYHFGRKSK